MATSRTGTARYKRNSLRVLHAAQAQGLTHCPCTANCSTHKGRRCSVPLDYNQRRRPNGASIDHIQAWNNGGTDDLTNLTVICLRCNSATGDKRQPKRRTQVTSYTPTTTTQRRAGRPPQAAHTPGGGDPGPAK